MQWMDWNQGATDAANERSLSSECQVEDQIQLYKERLLSIQFLT